MFGPLGLPEVLIILGIALVIFGPRRLPEMGRTLGRALGEFRRATTDLKRSVQFEMDAEDDRQRRDRDQAKMAESAEPKALPAATPEIESPGAEPEPAAQLEMVGEQEETGEAEVVAELGRAVEPAPDLTSQQAKRAEPDEA